MGNLRRASEVLYVTQSALSQIELLRTEVLAESSEPVGRPAMPVGLRERLTRPLVRKLGDEYPNVRVDIVDGNERRRKRVDRCQTERWCAS